VFLVGFFGPVGRICPRCGDHFEVHVDYGYGHIPSILTFNLKIQNKKWPWPWPPPPQPTTGTNVGICAPHRTRTKKGNKETSMSTVAFLEINHSEDAGVLASEGLFQRTCLKPKTFCGL
jgi:hypothetical protein